jgi:hypothetical protein
MLEEEILGKSNEENRTRKHKFSWNLLKCDPQPLPLLKPLVEPVPSLEMGRVVSGRASGVNYCLSTLLLNTDG